jgi:hypothetical protein
VLDGGGQLSRIAAAVVLINRLSAGSGQFIGGVVVIGRCLGEAKREGIRLASHPDGNALSLYKRRNHARISISTTDDSCNNPVSIVRDRKGKGDA